MELRVIDKAFTVCKVKDYSSVDLAGEFVFIAKTDEEKSLVCETTLTPTNTVTREDGWLAFRIEGVLDFRCRYRNLCHFDIQYGLHPDEEGLF